MWLRANAEAAAKEPDIDYEIEKITDMGVMMTPVLVINDTVVLAGKTSSPEEIKTILKNLQ